MTKEQKNAAFTNPSASIVASLAGRCEVIGIAALNGADGSPCIGTGGYGAYAVDAVFTHPSYKEPQPLRVVCRMPYHVAKELHFALYANELEEGQRVLADFGELHVRFEPDGAVLMSDGFEWEVSPSFEERERWAEAVRSVAQSALTESQDAFVDVE